MAGHLLLMLCWLVATAIGQRAATAVGGLLVQDDDKNIEYKKKMIMMLIKEKTRQSEKSTNTQNHIKELAMCHCIQFHLHSKTMPASPCY